MMLIQPTLANRLLRMWTCAAYKNTNDDHDSEIGFVWE